ncbi:transglutaminase family protein [Flavisolibacter ginsengisoli]|jgi:regulator of sirC expression with transglutaminase-like and TPR domain|uniref:Transglutaminase-like superfamily protein n=1 Tax=Flavisolibacter ginsengisoli DSM 18119 TaxID=1121884 RepID=A0A1M4XAI0_9BACT|nr:transglutaminase family protein [Flavisolibacter ginsengisoli]SHE90514.1 Transglutaminase-like superfamily protein [Flavisolibacter ginsengisoli DSM 18119]
MEPTKEISALLNLIDDPDEEVFGAVSNRIVGFGRTIIPNLENLWELTPDQQIQERIELIIHRLHYTDLVEDFRQWNLAGHHDLLVGSLLVAKFQFPELITSPVLLEVEKIRRNIWLELNNYLTPLEQVRIITGILYSYHSLKGTEIAYSDINEFLLNKILESKKGNQLSNGILYLILCDLLDIPVKAIGVPRQFVLAYFKQGYNNELSSNQLDKVEFFIDPTSGMVFTHKDIENYFKRISVPLVDSYFKPLNNKMVIQHLLEEASKCFDNEKEYYKKEEMQVIVKLLDE